MGWPPPFVVEYARRIVQQIRAGRAFLLTRIQFCYIVHGNYPLDTSIDSPSTCVKVREEKRRKYSSLLSVEGIIYLGRRYKFTGNRSNGSGAS
jgi:hypothetical protein